MQPSGRKWRKKRYIQWQTNRRFSIILSTTEQSQGVVGLYWKPATMTIPVSWAVCHHGWIFNTAAVYWRHGVSHWHKNIEQIYSYLGSICCRCSPAWIATRGGNRNLSHWKISLWSLPQEKAIKGNPRWVCLFPKWKIAVKLKQMPLTLYRISSSLAQLKLRESQWQRSKPAMNLSPGSQQLSVSRRCPCTSWHQSPLTGLRPRLHPPKPTHLIKVPLRGAYLCRALTGSSGARFGPRWVEECQGMSIVDGGEM